MNFKRFLAVLVLSLVAGGLLIGATLLYVVCTYAFIAVVVGVALALAVTGVVLAVCWAVATVRHK